MHKTEQRDKSLDYRGPAGRMSDIDYISVEGGRNSILLNILLKAVNNQFKCNSSASLTRVNPFIYFTYKQVFTVLSCRCCHV